ncbi:MAG: hypothetical protein DCF19_03820 [Pseudanabaena frigida]|uniref:Glycosyl hydrolase-like 10 domain-containing protein n=1 Tax=Pseudanabaena frigida TaxID=945775 RepID=A0A2W4WKR2_9CYAN|nr:MAG: hypothetical protein DCF19_03820 [Pseudanabaena frigida]
MKCNEALKKLNKFDLLSIASFTCLSTAFAGGAIAGPLPERILWGNPTCDVSTTEILRKHELRKSALLVNPNDQNVKVQYQGIVQKHRTELQACRDRTAPQTQATWIRLYPNDVKAGVLEDVFDKVANRGYNQVFIEVFYDGRVLLPVADNPTPWRSVMEEAVKAGEVPADYDLWKQAIAIGRERGIKVYGWSFAMNFGYGYSEIKGRSGAVAINGNGENSISNTNFDRKLVANGKAFYEDAYEADHLFADPYSPIAKADLTSVVKALMQRNPDGMVFDYVRYPTNSTGALIDNVKQLWIHGQSSRTALLNSIDNRNVRELMALYLQNGNLTAEHVVQTEKRLSEAAKVKPTNIKNPAETAAIAEGLLWNIATNHAYQGVINFVTTVTAPLKQNNIPIGTVFFPNGNRTESGKFEARMQPWDRFPAYMERHPMTYALCNDGSCVADQVTEVVRQSATETLVCPVLAGTWGQGFDGHPSFEKQMQAIRAKEPKINCFSHFVYAWMEPESDRLRKAGKATGLESPTIPN